MTTIAPRLYIVDEHERVRRALADRLTRSASVEVVGDSGDAAETMLALHQIPVDVVLVEIKRSDGMGLELVREISSIRNGPKVIVLTTYPTDWEEEAARRAGAAAYLLKDLEPEELLKHILAEAGHGGPATSSK